MNRETESSGVVSMTTSDEDLAAFSAQISEEVGDWRRIDRFGRWLVWFPVLLLFSIVVALARKNGITVGESVFAFICLCLACTPPLERRQDARDAVSYERLAERARAMLRDRQRV